MSPSDGNQEDSEDGVFPGFASFRDDEGSPFYRSDVRVFGTPEGTAAEITGRLSRVVFAVVREAARRPLTIGLDDLLRWHAGIFKTTFPYQAGKIRTAQAQFGVRWREDGELRTRLVTGSDPGVTRAQLRAAFALYNAERERRARRGFGLGAASERGEPHDRAVRRLVASADASCRARAWGKCKMRI